MDLISIDDFKKMDLRVGKIIAAAKVAGSDKLIRLQIDAGDTRQVVAGIGKNYAPEELVGKSILIIVNLEPRKLMGLESQGMLLAVSDESGLPVVLIPEKEVPPGSGVK